MDQGEFRLEISAIQLRGFSWSLELDKTGEPEEPTTDT